MTNTKKKVWMISGAAVLVVAAVLVGLFTTGNLFGTPASEDYAAEVTIDGVTTKYTTAAEAWQHVVTDKETHVKLLKDWNADADGNFGDGGGFFNGMIYINRRSTNLYVDLNGFTINKGLYNPSKGIDKPKDCGGIFYFCADATVEISNGTLRGGNAYGDGGAIYFGGENDQGRLRLTNITITSNKATGNGSAIWCNIKNVQEFSLNNVTITGNQTEKEQGGAVYLNYGSGAGDFYVHNKVLIKDNAGPTIHGNNLCMEGQIKNCEGLSADSKIVLWHNMLTAGNSATLCVADPSYHSKIIQIFDIEFGHLQHDGATKENILTLHIDYNY